jgi:hypothetical protein
MLKGKNKNILPLKIFGCMCFVQNNKPNVEKLNPKAMKYIFVGYSGTQKSMYASSVKYSLFVSMNVTFQELELYYSLKAISPFWRLAR